MRHALLRAYRRRGGVGAHVRIGIAEPHPQALWRGRGRPPHRQDIVLPAALGLHQNCLRACGSLTAELLLTAPSARRLLPLRRRADQLRRGRSATDRRLWLFEAELAAVAPHRMHDYRELARDCHAGALITARLGDFQPLRLEAAEAAVARQHAVGGLIEGMPDVAVTGSGDVPLNID
jgi:hypothetical protein